MLVPVRITTKNRSYRGSRSSPYAIIDAWQFNLDADEYEIVNTRINGIYVNEIPNEYVDQNRLLFPKSRFRTLTDQDIVQIDVIFLKNVYLIIETGTTPAGFTYRYPTRDINVGRANFNAFRQRYPLFERILDKGFNESIELIEIEQIIEYGGFIDGRHYT